MKLLTAKTLITIAAVFACTTLMPGDVSAESPVTKKCSTGGFWYMTDTMYITRTYLSSTYWKYYMTRSPNRTLQYESSPGNYHNIYHRANLLTHFKSRGPEFHYGPATTLTMYSNERYDDFKIEYHLTDGATMDVYTSCWVYF